MKCDVREDPARAQPPAGDADYERRSAQFRELGFVPAGISMESAWFLTPFKWYWRTLEGERWFVSPDGRTFVTLNRLIREEPVRFGACTIFDGDAIVRTSCPGAGIATTSGNYRRHELRKVDPAALLAAHAEHVEAFSRETGRLAREANMKEVADAESEHSRQLLLGRRRGLAETRFQLSFFGVPSALAFALLPSWVGSLGDRLRRRRSASAAPFTRTFVSRWSKGCAGKPC